MPLKDLCTNSLGVYSFFVFFQPGMNLEHRTSSKVSDMLWIFFFFFVDMYKLYIYSRVCKEKHSSYNFGELQWEGTYGSTNWILIVSNSV